jgi:hypothetical protein
MQGFREILRKDKGRQKISRYSLLPAVIAEVFVRVKAMQGGYADCSVYTNNCLLQVVTRN